MDIKLASPVAGGSGSTSAGLRTWPNAKKKRVNSVYSCSASYKKPKNPKVNIEVVDLSAGPLGLANIGDANSKFLRSWDSKIESEASSMSSLLDLENIKNTITKETSYANSDTSVVNNMENDTTPRKTCTQTYVLDKPPKTLLFDVLSNNDDMVALLSPKFAGFKKLHSIGSYVPEKCIFNPVKSFALDIGISALSGKIIGDKLIALSLIKAKKLAVSEKILVNIDVKKPNIHLDRKVIVKKIPVDLLDQQLSQSFLSLVM
ncbi:hypothetical protein G9A89_013648 [Geosiphon pyriformis]|nr:hypothetical protein G9A89_013648 [Geosiphon pyriformis]